jgi:hypothetical protein
MSYGHVIEFDCNWIGQSRRPVIDLRRYEAGIAMRNLAVTGVRLGIGAAIGSAFGATTQHPLLWLTTGTLVGWAFNRLRARSRQR